MEDQTVRGIARHILPILAGGDDPELDNERRSILFWACEDLPEPEPDARWLPEGDPGVYWLTAPTGERPPHLMVLSASAPKAPASDSEQPALTVATKGIPIDDRWTVELESEYGALAPDAGFRTRWEFRRDGETVLRIEGERRLTARHCPEWRDDPAEVFARLLASRVGWAEGPPAEEEA